MYSSENWVAVASSAQAGSIVSCHRTVHHAHRALTWPVTGGLAIFLPFGGINVA